MANSDDSDTRDLPTCVVCGVPATVRIAEEKGPDGEVVLRHYCSACAQRLASPDAHNVRPRSSSKIDWSTWTMVLGIALGVFGLAADYLGLHGQEGFGWHQQLGVFAGLIMVLVGAAFRIGFLGIAGVGLLVLALAVDVLAMGRSSGIGPRQQVTLGMAAALLFLSLYLRRRNRSTA